MSAEPDWTNHYHGADRGWWRIMDSAKPAWRLDILPEGGFSVLINEGKPVPNAFHRMMQRLVLGFKWTRLPTPKAPS